MVSQGLVGKAITCLTPTTSGTLLVGAAPGTLFRTRDFENWEALYEGIKHPAIHSVAADPIEAERLYCGTSPAALFVSKDGGARFELMPGLSQQPSASKWTFPVAPYRTSMHRILLHPAKPSVLLAGVRNGGLYISGDAGDTWHDRSQGCHRELNDFCIHPSEPSRIFAATGIGFYRSDDLGVNWQSFNQGLPSLLAGPIAVAAEEPTVVFMPVHKTREGGAYVLRSANAGQTWSICPGSLPYQANARVSALISTRGLVLLGTDQGELFGSTNFGQSWQILKSHFPPIHALSVIYQS